MNRWDCDVRGCNSSAVGMGGAIGLRAIGWYFVPGGPLRCPSHRPDVMPCRDALTLRDATPEFPAPEACPLCRAGLEAAELQELIAAHSRTEGT